MYCKNPAVKIRNEFLLSSDTFKVPYAIRTQE